MAWAVTVTYLGLSVWGNGMHATAGGAALTLTTHEAVIVSATPPVSLGFALHLLILMLRPRPAATPGTVEEGGSAVAAGPAPAPGAEAAPGGVEVPPAVPALHRHGTEHPGTAAEQAGTQVDGPTADPTAARVATLLPAAPDIAREIGGTAPPSGRALVRAMRAREHRVPNAVVRPLAEAVAERWAA